MKRLVSMLFGVALLALPAIANAQSYQGNYGIVTGFSGGTLSAQLKAPDGTVLLPAYAFAGDPATGMYRTGGGTLGFAVGGSLQLTVANSFIVIGNSISLDSLRGSSILTISARINTPLHTPATSAEACTVGDWSSDASFVYVCTATNTWKRATLAAF